MAGVLRAEDFSRRASRSATTEVLPTVENMSITREFFRHPMRTGAIAASSARLAEVMTAGLGVESAHSVVELGAGTGVFTEVLLRMLQRDAHFTAVEINTHLVQELHERFPTLHIAEGSAEHVAAYVTMPVDVVVSGLPWTAMHAAPQTAVLNSVCGAPRRAASPPSRTRTPPGLRQRVASHGCCEAASRLSNAPVWSGGTCRRRTCTARLCRCGRDWTGMDSLLQPLLDAPAPLVYLICALVIMAETALLPGIVLPTLSTLLLMGFLVQRGTLQLWPALTVCVAAALAGTSSRTGRGDCGGRSYGGRA